MPADRDSIQLTPTPRPATLASAVGTLAVWLAGCGDDVPDPPRRGELSWRMPADGAVLGGERNYLEVRSSEVGDIGRDVVFEIAAAGGGFQPLPVLDGGAFTGPNATTRILDVSRFPTGPARLRARFADEDDG